MKQFITFHDRGNGIIYIDLTTIVAIHRVKDLTLIYCSGCPAPFPVSLSPEEIITQLEDLGKAEIVKPDHF